jgi:hypothetical protein
LLAGLVVLIATDRLVMRSSEPWSWAHQRLSHDRTMDYWISLAQMRRWRFARERDDRTRVVALGSSRAAAAFVPDKVSISETEWVHATTLGRPGIDPFVLRSMVDGVVALDPDVVVLYISEFDTHRAMFLIPRSTDPDLPSLVELLRYTSPDYCWDERHKLLQILAGGILETYHHRDVLLAAGLGSFSEFEMGARGLDGPAPPAPARRFGSHRFADWHSTSFAERVAEIEASHGREIPLAEFGQLYEMLRGEQVRAQESMIESAIERFGGAGVQVLIFETPLNPLGAALSQAGLRDDFLAFARRMERTHDSWFIPLERSGPFGPEQFADLTHLNFEAAVRTTRLVLERIHQELPDVSDPSTR